MLSQRKRIICVPLNNYKITKVFVEQGYEDTDKEINNIMATLHVDKNHEINYSEFIAATLDKKLYLSKEKLWSVFKYFDIDNSNFITVNSLKEAMARGGRKIPQEDLEEMIREIDSSLDGKVSWEEFYEMMKNDNFEVFDIDSVSQNKKSTASIIE
jgi:Ca2+-binding EF-hand superfamily protein